MKVRSRAAMVTAYREGERIATGRWQFGLKVTPRRPPSGQKRPGNQRRFGDIIHFRFAV
jgi:hypothetical protein